MNKYHWHKQKMVEDCETIRCPSYDPIRDFKLDPSGYYLLIRINREAGDIEVALCTKEHQIVKIFIGKTPQEIYHTMVKVEREQGQIWFADKEHVAYLGKELRKAEQALKDPAIKYVQE